MGSTRTTRYLMAALVLSLAGLAFAGCGIDQRGMVLLTDESYRATVLGTNNDGFTVPDGIRAVSGKLYLADEGGSAFRIWSGSAHVKTISDPSSGIKSPEDFVMDGEGNIYFTDDDAGGVWHIDDEGRTSLLAGKDRGLVSTEGIALTPSGDILVGEGESHTIFSVAPNGETKVFLGPEAGIRKAESMVFDEAGNLFIADNTDNILYLMSPDGKLHRMIENRQGFSPETLWYADGVLYITDSQNGRLHRYTQQDGLRTIAVFGGRLGNVGGVTTDERGSIYVTIQTDLKKKQGYILRLDREN